ncbi:MAG: hypothetical protein ACI4UL_01255 [Muribaculaceae bacterium]
MLKKTINFQLTNSLQADPFSTDTARIREPQAVSIDQILRPFAHLNLLTLHHIQLAIGYNQPPILLNITTHHRRITIQHIAKQTLTAAIALMQPRQPLSHKLHLLRHNVLHIKTDSENGAIARLTKLIAKRFHQPEIRLTTICCGIHPENYIEIHGCKDTKTI